MTTDKRKPGQRNSSLKAAELTQSRHRHSKVKQSPRLFVLGLAIFHVGDRDMEARTSVFRRGNTAAGSSSLLILFEFEVKGG
ncbi:unnamed protein product [Lasius platythorax]|uniref:Uncharacterized protein n=1 Tax=Lasius platythorax TaxID=488582 RepID=A0AAV2NKC6_9HYME